MLWALVLLAAGCGDDRTAEAEAPITAGPAVTCEDVTLSASAAEPLDTLVLNGVPEAMGDSLYTIVYAPADSLSGLAFTRRVASDRAAVRVPVHPGLRPEGGEVELTLSNGDVDCPAQRFTIRALPEAPGTMAATMDTSLVLMDRQAALFGVSPRELLEAPLERIPGPALPLAITRRLLGDPSDPESLLGRQRSGAPGIELLDRVFAKARANEVLAAQLRQVRGIEPFVAPGAEASAPTQGARPSLRGVLEAVGARLASAFPFRNAYARSSSQPPSTPPPSPPRQAGGTLVGGQCPGSGGSSSTAPPRRVSCAGAQLVIRASQDIPSLDAATLSALMDVSLRGNISLDPEVVQYLDEAIETVELGATGFGFGTALLPTKPNKAVSGSLASAFGTVGAYLRVVRLLREAESKVLPRYLTGLQVRMSPARYDEDQDDPGRITAIGLTAANEGWKLDRTIVEGLLSRVDIPWSKGVSKVIRAQNAPAPVRELGSAMIDELFAEIFDTVTTAPVTDGGESTGVFACVPSETFGPVSIRSQEWSQVKIIEGRSVERDGRLDYRPVDTGPTRFLISSEPPSDGRMRFGGQLARTCPVVEVQTIEIVMDPPSRQVEPGEEVVVQAEVLHSEHPDELEWSILQGGGTVLTARQIGSNLHEARIGIPDPRRGSVIVEARSTSDRSHLASGDEVRAGTTRLYGERVPLEPCGLEAMEAAAADPLEGLMAGQAPTPGAMVDDTDMSGASQDFVERVGRAFRRPGASILPGAGTLAISGIVNDGGDGCSGHLAATTLAGRNMTALGTTPAGKEQRAAVRKRLDELNDIVEGMDEEANPEQLRAAAEKSQEMLGASTAPAPGRPSNVVLPVYSPNVAMWQIGQIGQSEHSGVGGWQPNAAAHFVLMLNDATPQDLREGETFQAVAVAPEGKSIGAEPVAPEEDSEIPVSPGSFYARWAGRFQKIPVAPNLSSRSAGQAFEGILTHVYGRLTGTVTIEKITGTVIESSFQLSGEATLVETEYRFKCMTPEVYPPASAGVCDPDERLSGSSPDRNGEKRRTGPISIEGRLLTPNRSAGGGLREGYQNVVID